MKWASSHNFRSSCICSTEVDENSRTNADDSVPTLIPFAKSPKPSSKFIKSGVVRKSKAKAAWASIRISSSPESAFIAIVHLCPNSPLFVTPVFRANGMLIADRKMSLLMFADRPLET